VVSRGAKWLRREVIKLRGVTVGYEHVAVILLRHLYALRKGLSPVANDKSGNVILHELLEAVEPLLMAQGVKVCTFNPADNLYAVRVKVVIKAGQLHGGTVHIGGLDQCSIVILGGV
jgi:hypothetical protein